MKLINRYLDELATSLDRIKTQAGWAKLAHSELRANVNPLDNFATRAEQDVPGEVFRFKALLHEILHSLNQKDCKLTRRSKETVRREVAAMDLQLSRLNLP